MERPFQWFLYCPRIQNPLTIFVENKGKHQRQEQQREGSDPGDITDCTLLTNQSQGKRTRGLYEGYENHSLYSIRKPASLD